MRAHTSHTHAHPYTYTRTHAQKHALTRLLADARAGAKTQEREEKNAKRDQMLATLLQSWKITTRVTDV